MADPHAKMDALNDEHPLHSIPIEVTVSVGKARPMVRDLLKLTENAVLPLIAHCV